MSITTNTELALTKAEIVSALVQKELAFQAKLAPYARDVSMFAVKGMTSISYPKFTSFNVQERTSGNKFTPQALTATKDTLNLNIRAGIAWEIDPADELESAVDVSGEYIKRAVTSHARAFDMKLIAALVAAAGNTAPGGALSKDNILALQEFILGNDGEMSRLVMATSVTNRSDMLKVPGFVEYNGSGQNPSANVTGMIGFILGMPVIVHNGLAPGQSLVWDSEAICYGFQKTAAYDEQKDVLLGSGAKVAVLDQKYGVQALELGASGASATTSPLIAKLV